MSNNAAATEAVVRNHLRVFLEQRGIPAILEDYHDDARLYSEDRLYRGKQEIRDFFTGFIESLPPGSIGRFTLRSLRVDGNFAYLTWSAGKQIPLGADTFVVADGKIAAQTFAMFARG